MVESKFNGVINILLIVAIIGIIVLLGYFGWAAYSKYSLTTNAEDAVAEFEENTKKRKEEEGERIQIGAVDQGESIYNKVSNGEVQKYYGYEIIGTISIPKINIKYPILEKSTTQSIKVAIGYLSGPRN